MAMISLSIMEHVHGAIRAVIIKPMLMDLEQL